MLAQDGDKPAAGRAVGWGVCVCLCETAGDAEQSGQRGARAAVAARGHALGCRAQT